MKTKKLVIGCLAVLLGIAFTGCSKDDDENKDDNGSAITAEGEASGTVSNLSSNIDSVRVTYPDLNNIGEAKLNNNVLSFSLVDVIPDNYLYEVSDDFGSYNDSEETQTCTISDNTAKIGDFDDLRIEAYSNRDNVGYFIRSNNEKDLLDDVDGSSAGDATGFFIYCNKAVIIKGTYTDKEDGNEYSDNYNLEFHKGWNEVVIKVTNASSSKYTTGWTSNDEPSGMKWFYVPYGISSTGMKSASITKTKGIASKINSRLFSKKLIK